MRLKGWWRGRSGEGGRSEGGARAEGGLLFLSLVARRTLKHQHMEKKHLNNTVSLYTSILQNMKISIDSFVAHWTPADLSGGGRTNDEMLNFPVLILIIQIWRRRTLSVLFWWRDVINGNFCVM